MKNPNSLRGYYRPVQPAVKGEAEKISYQEVAPAAELEDIIYCFWQLKTQAPLQEPFVYRVVSDGCIDIFFNHRQASESFVMGFYQKYTQFPIGTEFDYIGIRFLPAAFSGLLGIDAKSLSNQSSALRQVLPELANYIQAIGQSSATFERIVQQLNERLQLLAKKQTFQYDQRFYKALIMIFQKRGYLDTEKELDTGLSPRQLRRVFNFYLGTTAKSFSNVVRFQHILHAQPSRQSLKDDKLYFDLGFYDQAHFIRHFKTFYGVTPSEAFD